MHSQKDHLEIYTSKLNSCPTVSFIITTRPLLSLKKDKIDDQGRLHVYTEDFYRNSEGYCHKVKYIQVL